MRMMSNLRYLGTNDIKVVRRGIHFYHIFVLTIIYYLMLKNVEWYMIVNFFKNPMEWTMTDYLSLWNKEYNQYYLDINLVYFEGNMVLYLVLPELSKYSVEYFCKNLFLFCIFVWFREDDDMLAFLFLYLFTHFELYLKYVAYYGNSLIKKIYEVYQMSYIRELHFLLISFLFLKKSI